MPASTPSRSTPSAALTCTVVVRYLSEESDPAQDRYAFAYTVTIKNTGQVTAQLIARQWLITDAHGRSEEVRGLGVVGHQPVLKPQEVFEYSSWTQLPTPTGLMQGTYLCITEDARWFDVPIAPFTLALPRALH